MIEKNETEIMKDWAYIEPPLLTVASVTFNHENYISESLDGILMQETDFPFEIIVHDDCSTDNTAKIIEEYANAGMVILHDKIFNSGPDFSIEDEIWEEVKNLPI